MWLMRQKWRSRHARLLTPAGDYQPGEPYGER
jgi:hypothetical protein